MSDASPVAPEALDQAEKARLVRLERTVDRAVEVAGKIAGEALATIRDERLYRTTHTTFEGYLRERFGISTSTAYRMIDAATAPEPAEVEGSSRGGTNPQPPQAREPEPEADAKEAGDREPVRPPASCPECGGTRWTRHREVIESGEMEGWVTHRPGRTSATCQGCGWSVVSGDPEPEPAMPPDAGRLWARVVATPLGSVVLAVDSSTPELPEPGTQVLVAWER